jgi:glycine betaine/proline transport system substrate-binding protein
VEYPDRAPGRRHRRRRFHSAHWELLHEAFFQESGGDAVLQASAPSIEGMVQGYLVDKASYDGGVKNLSMLKDPAVAAKFDGDGDGKADLAGCVPGWGCERIIEHHMDEYGLRDTVTHNQGEYNALIGDTIARMQNGQPVLYFTWTPYWVSGALVPGKDVEWLDVPYTSLPDGVTANTEFGGKNLGFAVDNMYIRGGPTTFLADNPAAAAVRIGQDRHQRRFGTEQADGGRANPSKTLTSRRRLDRRPPGRVRRLAAARAAVK